MRKLLAVLCFTLFGTLAASAQSNVAIDLGATYASGGVTFTNLNPQGYNGQPQNNPAVGVFLGAAGTVTVTTLNSGQQYRVIACKSNGTACLLATIAVTGAAQDISATLLAYPIGTGSGSGTITGTMVSTRVPFGVSANVLTTDSDMTFATDTLTVTKIIGSTSITDSGLTSGRVTLASTAGLLADDGDLTFATDTLTATKFVGSTSITDSGLTATRLTFAGVAGLLSDDGDLTFVTDTLTATKIVGSTSITDTGLTATRVTYAGTGGLLSDSANMTFASNQLIVGAAGAAAGDIVALGNAPHIKVDSTTDGGMGYEGIINFLHGSATNDWQISNNDEGNAAYEFTLMERTNNSYKLYAKKGTAGDMYIVPSGGGLGVGVATSTDIPEGTIQTVSLLASGIVDGTAPVTVTASTPITVGGTYNSGYLFNEHATEATAITYNLPTAAAGKQYCIYNAYETAAETGVLTVATSAAGQFIIFTDGTLSATGGNVTSGGAARDAACFVGVDATHWMLVVGSGTWTKH